MVKVTGREGGRGVRWEIRERDWNELTRGLGILRWWLSLNKGCDSSKKVEEQKRLRKKRDLGGNRKRERESSGCVIFPPTIETCQNLSRKCETHRRSRKKSATEQESYRMEVKTLLERSEHLLTHLSQNTLSFTSSLFPLLRHLSRIYTMTFEKTRLRQKCFKEKVGFVDVPFHEMDLAVGGES